MGLTAFGENSPVEFAIILFIVFIVLSFAGSKIKWLSDNLEYVLMALGLYAVISLSAYPGLPQINEGLAILALGVVIIRMTIWNPINFLQRSIHYALLALFAFAFVHTLMFKILLRNITPPDFLMTTFTLYDILPAVVVMSILVVVGIVAFKSKVTPPEMIPQEETTPALPEQNETDESTDKNKPLKEVPQSMIDTQPDRRAVTQLNGSVIVSNAEVKRSPQGEQVVGRLGMSRQLTFIARTPDSLWLRFDTKNGIAAWIEARSVKVEGDISLLYVMAAV